MAEIEGFHVSSRVDATFLWNHAQLESLEKKLDQSILSPRELQSVSHQLDDLREQALTTGAKDTYQSLCGRVATLSVNNLVDAIVEESFALRLGKFSTQEECAERVHILKRDIARICHNHGLSIENRRFIKMAVNNLNNLFPPSKTDDILLQPEKRLRLNKPTTVPLESPNSEESETAFDLCEMAHYFYQNKFQEGVKCLNQLLPSQKTRLEEHCLATGAEMITKNPDLHNRLRFIQALIGYANEIAQGEGIDDYPSLSEVKMMFEEVQSFS